MAVSFLLANYVSLFTLIVLDFFNRSCGCNSGEHLSQERIILRSFQISQLFYKLCLPQADFFIMQQFAMMCFTKVMCYLLHHTFSAIFCCDVKSFPCPISMGGCILIFMWIVFEFIFTIMWNSVKVILASFHPLLFFRMF